MSTLMSRRRVGRASVTAVALAVASLALLPGQSAQAAVTGAVNGGTATWAINSYLSGGSGGSPSPLASAYVSPASFDSTAKTSAWGGGAGTVESDGTTDLTFKGTSVNFAPTSGAWLKITDPEVELDTDGNGTLTAVVAYGRAPGTFPNITYDPAQAPQRGPLRIDLVDLSGNAAADLTTTAAAYTWTDLAGAWTADFSNFLTGDGGAGVPPFIYTTPVVASAPAPLTFSASRATPKVAAAITAASPAQGVTVQVDGDGFRGVTEAGPPSDDGIYVGIAPSGGIPSTGSMADQSKFAVADWVPASALTTGTFSRVLTAPTAKLDPTQKYSVYTWQAHRHSNTTQDTETPLTINWDALKQSSVVAADWKKKPKNTKKKGQLTVSVGGTGGTPTGNVVVTLERKGSKKAKTVTATLVDGTVLVKLPKLKKGKWTLTAAYAGDTRFRAGTSAEVKVKVKQAKPKKSKDKGGKK